MTTTRRRGNSKGGGRNEQKHSHHTSRNNPHHVSTSSNSSDSVIGGNERSLGSHSHQKLSHTKKGRDVNVDPESNRNKFLFFMCSLLASEVEVELRDGRKFIGVFHTGVPLEGMSFDVVIRLARRSDGISPHLSTISL